MVVARVLVAFLLAGTGRIATATLADVVVHQIFQGPGCNGTHQMTMYVAADRCLNASVSGLTESRMHMAHNASFFKGIVYSDDNCTQETTVDYFAIDTCITFGPEQSGNYTPIQTLNCTHDASKPWPLRYTCQDAVLEQEQVASPTTTEQEQEQEQVASQTTT
eukprot:CAMPEP_0198487982 /NCGR_PEP_ID=MMETSP1462-20131121/413_1 /TAXON_ID=1333877 /ORGANISM="Brandtodinium nutriculum, Strain RCC3387" /LENGTH=162 /DNA_ID=CAMNT_0044216433 /DNA_START=100 /DNA_END=585 /DNA_ORIENTATION=-